MENQHEKLCLDKAEYFTAVRGMNPRTRTKITFLAMADAVEYAKAFGDGRTMIYAVSPDGGSAHIKNA
jgi:hypothetical protein